MTVHASMESGVEQNMVQKSTMCHADFLVSIIHTSCLIIHVNLYNMIVDAYIKNVYYD